MDWRNDVKYVKYTWFTSLLFFILIKLLLYAPILYWIAQTEKNLNERKRKKLFSHFDVLQSERPKCFDSEMKNKHFDSNIRALCCYACVRSRSKNIHFSYCRLNTRKQKGKVKFGMEKMQIWQIYRAFIFILYLVSPIWAWFIIGTGTLYFYF